MTVRHIKSDSVKINKDEALKYLGYKNRKADEATDKLLNETISELQEISELKYVYRIFNIKKENNSISFDNIINIKSKDIERLFKDCEKSAVMAATVGFQVEKRIKYYSMTNLSKGVVFDACADAFIEALCDLAEDEIKELAAEEGCGITFRYSPGYGDVPVSHQGEILSALNAQKLIGLTSSDSSILIPRKSVTAFIGFSKAGILNKTNKKSCLDCNLYESCGYATEGDGKCLTN
jgi:hypothetical protein